MIVCAWYTNKRPKESLLETTGFELQTLGLVSKVNTLPSAPQPLPRSILNVNFD